MLLKVKESTLVDALTKKKAVAGGEKVVMQYKMQDVGQLSLKIVSIADLLYDQCKYLKFFTFQVEKYKLACIVLKTSNNIG